MNATYKIARQEFTRLLLYPLVPIAVIIVIFIAYLNGAGELPTLQSLSGRYQEDMVVVGFGQCFQSTSMIITIMAVFLSATSIPYEKWNNSLNVLLTKPLYRNDYLAGKFVGLSAFMLLFNTFTILLIGLMTIMCYGGPLSAPEFVWRVIAYILIISISCMVVIALNMLIGIASKNILFVTTASIIYVFFDWIWYNDQLLGSLSVFTPMQLYATIIDPSHISSFPTLFDTMVPFYQWFDSAAPYILALMLELITFLLAGMLLFSWRDNT